MNYGPYDEPFNPELVAAFHLLLDESLAMPSLKKALAAKDWTIVSQSALAKLEAELTKHREEQHYAKAMLAVADAMDKQREEEKAKSPKLPYLPR